MTDRVFIDRDGNPVTGKVPVFIRVDGPTKAVPREVYAHLQRFLTDLRTSGLSQLSARVEFPGGSVRFVHKFGVTQAFVTTRSSGSQQSVGYFGGILIQPTYLTDTSYFGANMDASTGAYASRTIPLAVTSAGKSPSKPGRKAAAGVRATDSTDWLVVQIAGDRPLGSTPIADGIVKIYRLKAPKFGDIVEVADGAQTYLLSTVGPSLTPGRPAPLSEFYLCGQRVTSIPALVGYDTANLIVGQEHRVRMRSYGFNKTWGAASAARGVVILALYQRLYAVDTRQPGATWQLLDSFVAPSTLRLNAYGTTFTETELPGGGVRITCTGSNGAGVCSGFVVDIAPNGALSGALSPMHDGSDTAGSPASITFSKTVTATQTEVSPYNATVPYLTLGYTWNPGLGDFELTSAVANDHTHVFHARFTDVSMTMTSTWQDALPARIVDQFAGGFFPREERYSATYSWNISRTATFSAWSLYTKGTYYGTALSATGVTMWPNPDVTFIGNAEYAVPLSSIDLSQRPRRPTYTPDYLLTTSGTGSMSISLQRGPVLSYSCAFSLATNVAERLDVPNPGDTGIGSEASFSSTGSATGGYTDLPIRPSERFQYVAKDVHTFALALQREFYRTGTLTDIDAPDPAYNRDEVDKLADADATGWYSPTTRSPREMTQATYNLSNTAWALRLRTPSAVIVDIADCWTLAPEQPPDTAARSFRGPFIPSIIPPENLVGDLFSATVPSYSGMFSGLCYERLSTHTSNGVDPGDSAPGYGTNSGKPGEFHASISFALNISDTLTTLFPGDWATGSVSLSPAAFAVAFPASGYALRPELSGSFPPSVSYQKGPSAGGPIRPSEWCPVSSAVAPIRNFIYRDLRTGGYIYQAHWRLTFPGRSRAFLQTMIGNQYGAVSLVDVLNEWAALGENAGPVLTHVFVDQQDLQQVSLL